MKIQKIENDSKIDEKISKFDGGQERMEEKKNRRVVV